VLLTGLLRPLREQIELLSLCQRYTYDRTSRRASSSLNRTALNSAQRQLKS
jgi:hypothetical protein